MEGVSDLPSLPFAALARWDSGWYGAIAARGYWLNPDQQSPVAYFPLYPLLMRGLSWLGVNRWVAGSILSMGAALTAFFMFHRWAAKIAAPHALTAWLLLISYPYACYLYGTVYSDAVFLLLAVSAFIALESEAPVLSAFLGALACACRPIAPAVVIGLLVRSLERRKTGQLPLRAIDFVPALSGLGLAAYMFFLWTQFGDPLAFAHVHNAPGWEQPPGWASWLKDEFFHQMRVGHWTVKLRLGAHAFVTIGAMALVPATIRRVGWGYGLYCLVALALPAISSKDFQGMGRYAIGAFPLLIPMAAWLDEWAGIRNALLWVLPLLLGLCAGLLGTGAYVS
jgi:Gpi18-like mannosyltransferase